MKENFDFGFTSGEEISEENERPDNRAERMHALVGPLLDNLKRNPKAATIKWPDRVADIERFEQQLSAILYGERNVDAK